VIAELERFDDVRGSLVVDPRQVHQGERAVATATFRNVSAGRLTEVSMRLPAPDGWQVEPTTPTTVDRLSPGERFVVKYAVRAAPDATPGPTPLVADVTATRRHDDVSWPLGGEVDVAEPVAQVTVSAADRQARPGADVPIRVTVANSGDEPLEAASVTLAVPDGWTAPDAADLGTIAPGDSVEVELTVGVPDAVSPQDPIDEWPVTAAATYAVGDRSERATGDLDLLVVDPVDEGYATTEFAEAYLGQRGDRFEIHAGGSDLWGGTDEFAAIYRDGAAPTQAVVTTTVESQTESWSYAKAGIMIRDDLATHSPGYVFLAVTPGHGFVMQYDANGDGQLDGTVETGSSGYPAQLRLERDGSTYTGSYRLDGTTWTEVGTVELPQSAEVQDVGLFASAVNVFNPGVLTDVDFTGLTVNTP
jgi:NPCBM-associated, NEW3 domain of alpha-galactosidase